MVNKSSAPCPCCGKSYADCCAPYPNGIPASDAEALMRSRYSGYVLKLEPYLLATWHPDTPPSALAFAEDGAQWIGLDIKQHQRESNDRAAIELIARYKINGRAHRLHEISRFVHENGR